MDGHHSEDCGSRLMMEEKLFLTCDRLISHMQLACCPSHCAIPLNGKELLVHNHTDPGHKPLQLTGHHGDICAMEFGTSRDPLLLCSASSDYVIVWDIEHCYRRAREGQIASGRVIGTRLGKVVHLSFCSRDERVAACSGTDVYILNSKKEEVVSVLAGHLGPLTAAEFCPWDEGILVSISEDRTFKVWNLRKDEILYQSAVLTPSPLLSVFFLEQSRQIVTGSADGQVWCFTLPDDHKCNLVTRLDLHKLQQRHQRHLETEAQQRGGIMSWEPPDTVETAKPVLRMCASWSQPDTDHEQERDCSSLWMGSSDGLYLVDLATSELQKALHLRDYPNVSLTIAGSWSISKGWDNNMIFLVTSLFEPHMALLEVRMPGSMDSLCDLMGKAWAGGERMSVMPSAAPGPESPLNAVLKKRDQKPSKETGLKKRGMMEKPIVFHSQVKSSRYTEGPRMTMFSPKTNIQKTQRSIKTDKQCFLRDYPLDTGAPSVPHTHLSTSKTPTPVCCFQYSGDGKQILCGLGDRSVLLYKSSLTGTPAVYTGHDKVVSSVCWSHSRQWWISASEDRTLRIWSFGNPEPALIMASDRFSKPIRSAQFYYLDKFLLLASGPSLHLYLYHVDNTCDDIKRYQQRSVIQLTRRFETKSATDITGVSAINDFFSHIVLVCCSDRSIQVFDMNKGAVASELPDAHSRAVHHITQNKGSMFSTQAPGSYNLFLTSAVTDAVKLWDFRTLRCVRRYENHLNRCHPCTAAISPCGRFIASGSEDNCAYVYDIRSSSFLHKLQRQSDTVLNVAFNPSTPELLSGTLDGKLSLFRPSDGASLS